MRGQPLILPSHNSVSVSDLSCDLFSAVHLLQYISKTCIMWTRVCVNVGVNIMRLCVCTCTFVSACSHPHTYFPLLGKNPWFDELFIIHILLKKKIKAGGNMVVWYFHEWNSLHTSPLKKQEAWVWTHQQFECRPQWCSNILADANHYDWSCLLLSFQFMTE